MALSNDSIGVMGVLGILGWGMAQSVATWFYRTLHWDMGSSADQLKGW